MNNSQLDGLLALKLVAEKRNFSAAANVLGVSSSAMSQIIKQLEERLGVTLLSRTTRSTTLTEAGEQFLKQTGPAIDSILAAQEQVRHFAKKPSGLLRLNVARFAYNDFLESKIVSFRKKYPEILVECFIEDAASDVVEAGFDAGIRLSDILIKDMVATKLYGPVKFVTAASPKYLSKKSKPAHPKDLLNHDCIVGRINSEKIYDHWDFEHKGKPFEVQVKGSVILNDSLLMIKAAVNALGIVFTTEESIKDQVKSGKLELIMSEYASYSAGFYLYYPSRSQVSPKLRAFVDHLKS